MDETFYAGSDFNECAIVSHNDNFTLNLVTNLEVSVEGIPGMGLELLETESDTLLFVVEVEDNDVELLVELNHFFGMAYAAPREVSDVDETVYATEVDEHTVAGDVLDRAFEHLTLFELGDDFALLLFEFGLDESLVADNDVLEFLIDLHDLELHCLANEDVVVADRLNIDL